MKKTALFLDEKNGLAYYSGIGSVVDMKVDIVRIQHGVERILGPAAKSLLYDASKNVALKRYGLLYGTIKEDIKPKTFVKRCFEELLKTGHGIPEFMDEDEENFRFRVSVHNCFNASDYSKASKPVCYLMSGMIAAIFQVAYQREMDCEEAKCEAIDGEYCLFEVSQSGGKTSEPFVSREDERTFLAGKKATKKIEIEYDEKGNALFHGNNSIVSFREYWSKYQQVIERIIGPATKSIIYEVSKRGTREGTSVILKYLLKILRRLSKDKIIEQLNREVYSRGWGTMEVVHRDDIKKEITVRMRNCFNAVGYHGKSRSAVCYSMTGNVAGAASIFYGCDMDCVETKCEGKGDKYCEFAAKLA